VTIACTNYYSASYNHGAMDEILGSEVREGQEKVPGSSQQAEVADNVVTS